MPDTRGEDHGKLYGKSLIKGPLAVVQGKEVAMSLEENNGHDRALYGLRSTIFGTFDEQAPSPHYWGHANAGP